jgi:glycosyltransferase involved in cell wall biosynthesis
MNILMILSNSFTHDPRVYNEAISLINAGHKVTILAWDKKRKDPPIETKDGIKVIRNFNSKFMDLLPYDIFRMHFWWKNGYKDALKLFNENHFNVVHCHDLDTLPIGIKLKKKLGIPLIYDAHEIWGYMVTKDLPNIWANYYLISEKNIIKNVDRIITVNEPLKYYFADISVKPITIIMNCKPLQSRTYTPSNTDRFTLQYIGALAEPRFLLELIDVIQEIPDSYCIIGGIGKEEYVNSLKQKCSEVNNVDFIGRVKMEDVLPMTKRADAIICMTSPYDLNNSRATANKQFEAMVCGRPIICTKNTYPGIFTEKNDVGITVEFNKKSLKEGIIKLQDNPKICEQLGRRALKLAIEKYNWEKQQKKLVKLYEDICR